MASIDERRADSHKLQGGRRDAREAVLPVRDVPRHGHEPRRRAGDRRRSLASGTSRPAAIRRRAAAATRACSARATPSRPTRGRRTSCRGPDWYFYFLFYLLRIFKWPATVILGTVGIPTILLIIAFVLPFIDRRRERRLTPTPRRRSSRPCSSSLSMGDPHLQGRDGEGGARQRGRPGGADVGAESGLCEPGRRRRREDFRQLRLHARVTPTSAPAARTSARPTSAPRGRRAGTRTSSRTTSRTRRSSATT